MADPYIGEIRMFGGTFAPRDWAFCDGSMLPISEYQLLFALIGTIYGGDGQTTFALPDLRARVPIHNGAVPGLTATAYVIGQSGGVENVTLVAGQMPVHNHLMGASAAAPPTVPNGLDITGNTPYVPASFAAKPNAYGNPGNTVAMSAQAIAASGLSQAHDNMAPFLGVHFIIALNGIFPSQT